LNSPHLSFYFAFDWHRPAEWNFEQYCIPALTVWYIFEGSRQLQIGGDVYEVGPGDVVIMPAHTIVSTSCLLNEQGSIHYYSIGIQAIIGGVDWVKLYGIPVRMHLISENNELKRTLDLWRGHIDHANDLLMLSKKDSPLSAQATVRSLTWEANLKLWFSCLNQLVIPYMSNPDPSIDLRIKEICNYIRSHYDDALHSEDIARAVCLSEGHMRMIFREAMGMSPYQYALTVRMQKAKELLLTTQLPLSEISEEIGFESMSHFIGTFRKREGMTPAVYRNQLFP
jgi:AraC-like DNA-binding protein